MIGLLLIAHKPLGSALAEAARHVYCDVPAMAVLDVIPDATVGLALARAEQLVEQLDTGEGVLILTDLFGATPANIAAALAGPHVKVIAGVNLPMLLRAISYRAESLTIVAEKAASGGALGIINVGSAGPQRQYSEPSGREGQRGHQAQQQQQ